MFKFAFKRINTYNINGADIGPQIINLGINDHFEYDIFIKDLLAKNEYQKCGQLRGAIESLGRGDFIKNMVSVPIIMEGKRVIMELCTITRGEFELYILKNDLGYFIIAGWTASYGNRPIDRLGEIARALQKELTE